MQQYSKNILESLLFKIPEIKSVYDILDLGVITSSDHPEYSNIVSNFNKPNIILCIGLLTTCIVVERSRKNQFHCLVIGSDVFYEKCKKSDVYNLIHNSMLIKDYIPQPLSKKIVFIDSFDRRDLYGEVYTEIKTKKYVNRLVKNIADYCFIEDSELEYYYDIVKNNVNAIEVVDVS